MAMLTEFLPDLTAEQHHEVRIAIIEKMTAAGFTTDQLRKVTKRYDPGEDVTKVYLTFEGAPFGRLVVDVFGKH